MQISSPSLVELHAFLAVARTGSFRKAAEALCVTQAAVSRAVLRLETELGQHMFHRTPTGVELTPAGRELRKLTEKPVAALESAALKLRRAPDRMKLRLSVVTSLGNLWLMPRLEQFRRAHPEVDLEFRTYLPNETFARDDVDLWIDLKPGAQHQWPRQISARYLIGREIVAVCAPSLAKGVRGAADLLQRPILYHSNYPNNWDLWAAVAGVRLPKGWKGSGFDLVANLIGAARAGMGVAVVQKCMVESDLRSGVLVMPVQAAAETGRGYYLCRRRAQPAHAAADLFAEWVAAQAHESLRADTAPRRPEKVTS